MVRIAIVIPYASMANLAWDVFQEHTEQMRLQALDATEYSLDILVASTTQELLPQWPDCDAMIARGATYLDLCRRSLSIPVIELIINGTDIVNTLLQLRQKYGPVPATILGTQNMILGVEKLARQLGVDVTPYCFQENSLLEIRRCVEQAARDGKRVIIGGGTGCRLAEEIGLTSMLITSGREAFWNAISEAKQQAKISQVEREKALSFQTMLDNAYEGLVVIDRNQQISFLNTAAIQILQLSRREQYLGKPASSVFSTPALSRIVSATENTDEIIAYKNTHLSVKTKNMMMHGLRAGTVVSLLNAAQIQTTEDQLRKKLHYKGHKAKYTFGDIITRSPRMIACIQEAKAFAQTDSNIVVVGETGTGKELLSQSIHAWSRRSQNNFVAINCAALPENLLLTVCSAIYDPVTTTDELIPSGETSSYRSNPVKLSEFALSRKDPQYVPRAKEVLAVERLRRTNPGDPRVGEALLGHDPADTGLGSLVMALKPGDGSAREQAASCQRVLGGAANLAAEYATKRYRSNVVNWGMLPFIAEDVKDWNLQPGDRIYLPGIRAAVDGGAEEVSAVLLQNGTERPVTLRLPGMTREERDIVLAGCLINYYAK